MKSALSRQRLWAIIRFDARVALRDNMILYILAAPVFLAVALAFLLPSFQEAELRLAVDAGLGSHWLEGLEDYAQLEVLPDQEAVLRRVGRPDALAGLTSSGSGEIRILLQGNEAPETVAAVQAIVQRIQAGGADGSGPADYSHRILPPSRNAVRDYARTFLAMLAVLIGGVAAAFAMVEEKETKLTRAFAVSPLTAREYFLGRALWSAAVSLLGLSSAHLILGGADTGWPVFALAAMASLAFPLGICLLIGGLAANQIQAVASLKIVMFLYLALPMASLVLPAGLGWLLWPLPNYWLFRLFLAVYLPGEPILLPATLALASSLVLCLGLAASLSKRLSAGRNRRTTILA